MSEVDHVCLVLSLRMNGAQPLLLLHASVVWTGTTLALFVLVESMHRIGPLNYMKVKVMFSLEQAMKDRMGGGWSTPRPGRFTPGNDPVPIVQEAG